MSNNRHTTSTQPAVVAAGGPDLDLGAVRAFVAISEDRYFGEAADRLGVSQQAISKRIAKLESDLGVRLFFRTRNGADLTDDGRAFLHHARALVGIADQAIEGLRGRRRSLRIDVLDTRLASIDLIRAFHQSTMGTDVEIVTSNGLRTAHEALVRGSVDAAFARVTGTLDDGIRHLPAYLEPAHLIVGRDHPLARERTVALERLSGSTMWMPGNTSGSEWAEYFHFLADAFDLWIDTAGPDFGWDYFVDEIGHGERIGIVGQRCRLPWHPRTVQVPIVDPVPVYPWSLMYHRQSGHPALGTLIRFLARDFQPFDAKRHWLPEPDRTTLSQPASQRLG